MEILKEIKTRNLVEELVKREGVDEIWAEPHQVKDIKVEGPARVLIITD